MNQNLKHLDITPSPRILRTLGEIPFAPWQCIAELIDNSIDALTKSNVASEKRIIICWSRENTPPENRVFEITDTGGGMSLEVIQKCVKAGFSSNDPFNNLGLFGMGFNISTAKLGVSTEVLSASKDSANWVGVKINFADLERNGNFTAPVLSVPKATPSECGTRIVVKNLNNSIFNELSKNEGIIRKTLEDIYAPILRNSEIEIRIQGKKLLPRELCTWGSNRFVVRSNERIPALIEINHSFGEAYFDLERNAYLSPYEEVQLEEKYSASEFPKNIVKKQKTVTGWLGIQRFADPNDFGLDFIRNGRKILLRNKNLFQYENPFTGTFELEYPLELGNTVGGRIVGEIVVDHLKPTYQKNDFDRSDISWLEVVSLLRGSGPILPSKRKTLNLPSNDSPISKLINAYRRVDAGSKCLFVANKISKEWSGRFFRGEQEYLTDEKWWRAVQQEDQNAADKGSRSAGAVNSGNFEVDDISDFYPQDKNKPLNEVVEKTESAVKPASVSQVRDSVLSDLLPVSELLGSPSGLISYSPASPGFNVSVYKLKTGATISQDARSVPFQIFKDGIDVQFFFNPNHPVLLTSSFSYKEYLAILLAERFKIRDNQNNLASVFDALLRIISPERTIDRNELSERARSYFNLLREKGLVLLTHREREILDCIHESSGEVEETIAELISAPEILQKFQARDLGALAVVSFIPNRTLLRLIEKFPEEWMDGRFFKTPYSAIKIPDENANKRLQEFSKERIISYLKDALWLIESSQRGNSSKDELARCSHSLNFLSNELVL